jgi:type IV secretory pathway TraG/TraD family ATPase VirD4
MKRVIGLENYDCKDITGLRAHLNLLINSELGDYLNVDEKAFHLANIIEQNAVVYFALPALRFPSFSKVLGKLVINDLKAVIDRQSGDKRVFMIFDEFSVFAGDQVLNLVNMGRGKGVHAIFGTQGLADLDKVDPAFKNQLLNCVNTIICHRLNDQESAETISAWVGTEDKFKITAQLDVHAADAALGTVRETKEFCIHPDAIKQGLGTGDAFLVSKVGGFRRDKVKVKYS